MVFKETAKPIRPGDPAYFVWYDSSLPLSPRMGQERQPIPPQSKSPHQRSWRMHEPFSTQHGEAFRFRSNARPIRSQPRGMPMRYRFVTPWAKITAHGIRFSNWILFAVQAIP